MADRRSYAITAAVWLGSLVLVGVPTLAILSTTRGAVLFELGIDPGPWLLVAIAFVEIAVSVYTVNVVTRVRLHGYRDLHGRSAIRTLARHVVLVVPAAVVVGFVGYLVLALGAGIGANGGGDPLVLASFAIAVVAFLVLVGRTATALRSGLREGSPSAVDTVEFE